MAPLSRACTRPAYCLGIIGIRVWDTQIGIINYFFTTLLGMPRVSWLGNPDLVIPALSITTVWWTFGFPMLVFIAGLHNIPEPLYEAAKIDGAGPLKTFRHVLGTAQADDVLIFEEKDTGMFTGVGKTNSEKYILVDIHDHDTSEIWVIDAEAPAVAPKLIAQRVKGIEYDVEHWNDRFIIKTNINGAEDYKIVTCPVDRPSPDNWIDLVPHRPGIFLVGYFVLKNWLVRMERENALPRIIVRDMNSGDEHAIAFEEEAYALGMAGGYEFDTTALRFTYSSMTTPAETYDYDVVSRMRLVRKRQEVPSGHNPQDYVTRRLFAPSHDGELVPVTSL